MDKIIFTIEFSEEEIQSFAETNFGRELTDIELNRIKEAWWDSEKVSFIRLDVLHAVIQEAMDTKNSDWSGIDNDFLAKK